MIVLYLPVFDFTKSLQRRERAHCWTSPSSKRTNTRNASYSCDAESSTKPMVILSNLLTSAVTPAIITNTTNTTTIPATSTTITSYYY